MLALSYFFFDSWAVAGVLVSYFIGVFWCFLVLFGAFWCFFANISLDKVSPKSLPAAQAKAS